MQHNPTWQCLAKISQWNGNNRNEAWELALEHAVPLLAKWDAFLPETDCVPVLPYHPIPHSHPPRDLSMAWLDSLMNQVLWSSSVFRKFFSFPPFLIFSFSHFLGFHMHPAHFPSSPFFRILASPTLVPSAFLAGSPTLLFCCPPPPSSPFCMGLI